MLPSLMLDGQETGPIRRQYVAQAKYPVRPGAAGRNSFRKSGVELTDELLDVAQFSIGGKVVRPATGYLGPNGVVRGRPPERGVAKTQVTLRLDPDVLDRFRADGPGWQGRINAALRKAVGLR